MRSDRADQFGRARFSRLCFLSGSDGDGANENRHPVSRMAVWCSIDVAAEKSAHFSETAQKTQAAEKLVKLRATGIRLVARAFGIPRDLNRIVPVEDVKHGMSLVPVAAGLVSGGIPCDFEVEIILFATTHNGICRHEMSQIDRFP
jgi:hypothetical protein